jgi:phosphoribosyl 1,2-cyclic phosphodiesterase
MSGLNVEFWGVRGTFPASGPGVNKYGGHTLCSRVKTSDNEIIVIDAGTGIKKLGDVLLRENRGKEKSPLVLHLLLTHFHLDHIMGLPGFAPLYSPHVNLTIYADCPPEEAERFLKGLMGGRYFPVAFEETRSKKIFRQIPAGEFEIGQTCISSCPLHHPQGSVAYRFRAGNQSIVLATDTEHPEHGVDERLAAFSLKADVFVYDATFSIQEYQAGKKGWGHSTWLAGTALAAKANVKNLCLSHFNPDHSDRQIDEIISSARREFPSTYGAKEKDD